MSAIKFDYSGIMNFTDEKSLSALLEEAKSAKELLDSRKGPGNDFLGWLDLAQGAEAELAIIEKTASEIRENSDIFIVIGIGGSYLGSRAAISAINGIFANELSLAGVSNTPAICFSGCDMSGSPISQLLSLIKGKKVYINVVSKSGTTTEPAIAFRLLFDALKKELGEAEAKKRVIATTDKARGALKTMADKEGWRTFVISDDVGGRFSVLSPVGLLPVAVAGIDIRQMLAGALEAVKMCSEPQPDKNIACMYAAARNLLYRSGKGVEVLASFEPAFHYLGEWWKQLYGESEGKGNKGIYPDSLDFSTDLHSMGQYIQQGQRIIMETFIEVAAAKPEVILPKNEVDLDGLNYLAGKTMHHVNMTALQATAKAHIDGGVPVMKFLIPEMNAFYLGELFYIFEYACGVSAYILGVNPFDQPGVESYKKNMFALLGKSGFEELRQDLLSTDKKMAGSFTV